MHIDTVRATVTLIIIGTFAIITISYTIIPLVFGLSSDAFPTAALEKFLTVYSGVVGIIVGFLFGSRNSVNRVEA